MQHLSVINENEQKTENLLSYPILCPLCHLHKRKQIKTKFMQLRINLNVVCQVFCWFLPCTWIRWVIRRSFRRVIWWQWGRNVDDLLYDISFFLNKIVYLVYRSFLVSFSHGGTGVPCPPFSVFSATFYPICPLCLWWLVVVGGCMRGIGVSAGVGWHCDPWHAYLNRFSPAPSSHCGLCTLIWCAGTRDPRIQRWVACTKVISILLLTYPHVFN